MKWTLWGLDFHPRPRCRVCGIDSMLVIIFHPPDCCLFCKEHLIVLLVTLILKLLLAKRTRSAYIYNVCEKYFPPRFVVVLVPYAVIYCNHLRLHSLKHTYSTARSVI